MVKAKLKGNYINTSLSFIKNSAKRYANAEGYFVRDEESVRFQFFQGRFPLVQPFAFQ